MHPIFHSLAVHILTLVSPVAAAAAGSLLASIWEGTLLVAGVWLCLKALPGLSAAARSLLWLAVLLLVILLPWLSFGWSNAHAATVSQHGALHFGMGWSLLLAGAWAAASAFRLTQLAVGAMRLRGLARRAQPVRPAAAISALLQSSSRAAELCVSAEVDRPSVAGFFRPRILLPPDLLASLGTQELEQVVLHELEHLRRRDDWTNLLQKLGLALLPLNPVLLWLDRRLSIERELACDDGVLRVTNARKAYAACLAGLAEHSIVCRGVLLALGMFGKRHSELERRVYRILARPEAAMGSRQARMASGFVLAGAACAAMALASSPRLISFGPVGSFPAAGMQVAETARQVPASFAGPARPVLVKATAPAALVPATVNLAVPRRPGLVPAVAARNSRKASILETDFQQFPAQAKRPHSVLASWTSGNWASRGRSSRQLVPASASRPAAGDAADQAPRLVLAVDQDSQIRYAAVAVQGGWLIVQL